MGACAGATEKPKRKSQLKNPKFKNRALCPLQPAAGIEHKERSSRHYLGYVWLG